MSERLDTVVSAETPEGITIELRPAGLTPRLFAQLIDILIMIVVLYLLVLGASRMQGLGAAAFFISLFLLMWFYPVVFELSRWAATPGKLALGLKVVMDNGLPVTPAASVSRNLIRYADFLPLMFGFGAISVLIRRDFKRLGDIAAGTLVVYRSNPVRKIALSDLEPLAPSLPLPPRDQAAVIALAARAPGLTRERLDELAALAAAVSNDRGRSGPEVTRRVLAVAQWLLGRR